MEINRFGQFLINSGGVDEDAVLDALTVQRRKRPHIGQIAFRRKMFTLRQVPDVLTTERYP
ncbi:MAG TPA: hypothetical protein EYP56_21360 [Planctomycetaceae bacterium]|nr:hypothetical protein [Planctomycetaceae bacterium]